MSVGCAIRKIKVREIIVVLSLKNEKVQWGGNKFTVYAFLVYKNQL